MCQGHVLGGRGLRTDFWQPVCCWVGLSSCSLFGLGCPSAGTRCVDQVSMPDGDLWGVCSDGCSRSLCHPCPCAHSERQLPPRLPKTPCSSRRVWSTLLWPLLCWVSAQEPLCALSEWSPRSPQSCELLNSSPAGLQSQALRGRLLPAPDPGLGHGCGAQDSDCCERICDRPPASGSLPLPQQAWDWTALRKCRSWPAPPGRRGLVSAQPPGGRRSGQDLPLMAGQSVQRTRW